MTLQNNVPLHGYNITDRLTIEVMINAMLDWVRVLDPDDNIIYMNKAMSDALGYFPQGQKCYETIGKKERCENCISRKAVFHGVPHEKEEVINERIYSVISSPIKDENEEIIAVVEVLRDITQMKKLQKRILRQNKKLQDDLSIARKLQCSLLPKNLPEDKINFSYIYKPCEALGGDFLDIFSIDNNHVGIYIADVSGHGVSASMLTVFLRSAINKKTLSPAQALKELYLEFNRNGFDPDLYITVFYAIINTADSRIVYSNAGHTACPVLLRGSELEMLQSPGIPISNWVDTPSYTDQTELLQHGDRVFLYTDGITEIKNSENQFFGEERLLTLLCEKYDALSSALNHIMKAVTTFAGTKNASDIYDDITIALLEYK